jgi:hypothetical protein
MSFQCSVFSVQFFSAFSLQPSAFSLSPSAFRLCSGTPGPQTNLMLTVDARIKDFFFDRARVRAALARAEVKVLSKAGAFVRRRARTSLRRRKKTSAPGTPPSVHSTDNFATLKNILFGLEPGGHAVVVGPRRTNQKLFVFGQRQTGAVPGVLEYGGTIGMPQKRVGNRWVAMGRRKPRPGQPSRVKTVTIAARPFMGPALVAESKNFPGLFVNSVSG